MKFSVIIPVYNRRQLIAHAVANAITIVGDRDDCEIVVVDDCSIDGTADELRRLQNSQHRLLPIVVVTLERNSGVTAARNHGVLAARGTWLVFLDSDDAITLSLDELEPLINRYDLGSGLIFFRSQDSTGALVGPPQQHAEVFSLQRMLHESLPGECLAVVKRAVMLLTPFEDDLRGFEGLTWCRIVSKYGSTVVVPIIARRYCTDTGIDRLSSRPGVRRRACNLAAGWWRFLRLFGRSMAPAPILKGSARLLYYSAVCMYTRIRRV